MSAVSVYCERVAPGLLGEPLNTLTNLAFLLAAWLCWRRAGSARDRRLLAALLFSIGLGSAAFHAFATPLTQLFDVVPIALLQLAYLYLYLRRVAGWKGPLAAASLAVYVASLAMASQWPAVLNGSLGYAPAALALLMLGFLHLKLRAHRDVLFAAVMFLLSLAARSVDMRLCPYWPWGTHFLWHLLNAALLYQLLTAYGRATDPTSLNR